MPPDGIVILPESTATYYQRPDASYVQLGGISPTEGRPRLFLRPPQPLIAEFAVIAAAYHR